MLELTEKQKQAQNAGIVIDIDKLHQVSEPIGRIEDTELFKLVDKMEKILIISNGIGLAGCQIGIMKQIFVMAHPEGRIESVMNPEIIKSYWQKDMISEGCLSLPDEKLYVVGRPKKVTVKYMTVRNKKLEEVETEFKDIFATIFMHEFDHLQGKLYIDYK